MAPLTIILSILGVGAFASALLRLLNNEIRYRRGEIADESFNEALRKARKRHRRRLARQDPPFRLLHLN